MVRVTAKSKREFAYGQRVNVRDSFRGGLELTSKNLLPDPRFAQFRPNGDLLFYGPILMPPILRGRNIYVRPRGGRMTKENIERIGPHRSTYLIDEPLIRGGEDLPGRTALEGVPKAATPIVRGVADDVRGYPAGNYLNGLVYFLGNPRRPGRRRMTLAGPASDPFTLTEGQTYLQPLPESLPHEEITAIGIVQTIPGGNYGTVMLQEIIDVRDFIPPFKRMRGPLLYGIPVPSVNETYIGAHQRYGPPKTWFGRSNETFYLNWARLSWQFKTAVGWSAFQQDKVLDPPDKNRKNTAMYVYPPVWPRLAEFWRFCLKMDDGRWYTAGRRDMGQADGALPPGQPGLIYAANSEKWAPFQELINVEYQYEDLTGIENPTEQLEAPDISGVTRISPGGYAVRVTDVYDRGESRPSDPDSVVLTTGQNLEVRLRHPLRRRHGNILPNADGTRRKPNGTPRFWTINQPTQLTFGDYGPQIRDSRGLTTGQKYATMDAFEVNVDVPMTLRWYVDVLRRVAGQVTIQVQALNSAGAVLATHNTASTTTALIEATLGPVGSGADFIWPAGTRDIQASVWGGLGADASVNLDADIYSLGLFVGFAAPRKRAGDPTVRGSRELEEGPVPLAEDHTLEYPDTHYGVVVADYGGAGVNALEYYAPYDQQLVKEVLLEDFELSIEPDTVYTLQITAEGRGQPSGASGVELLGGIFLDEEDNTVGTTPPIVPTVDASQQINGVQSVTWAASPPTARKWRATYNTVGRGRLVLYKPQLEVGAAATAWTADYSASGTVTQIFETWCPGAPTSAENGWLSVIKRFVDIVARAELPDNTSVSARVAFKDTLNVGGEAWGPWLTDPAQITPQDTKRYGKIELTLANTDLSVSPEVYEYGFEVERDLGVLLRENGTEYVGGISVGSMPAISYPPNAEARRNRLGQVEAIELFPAEKELDGLELWGYDRRGVEAAARDASRGDRLFRINYKGKEYLVQILGLKFELESPEVGDLAIWHARDVSGQIVSVEEL